MRGKIQMCSVSRWSCQLPEGRNSDFGLSVSATAGTCTRILASELQVLVKISLYTSKLVKMRLLSFAIVKMTASNSYRCTPSVELQFAPNLSQPLIGIFMWTLIPGSVQVVKLVRFRPLKRSPWSIRYTVQAVLLKMIYVFMPRIHGLLTHLVPSIFIWTSTWEVS
jgi:hypothetical protein